MRNYKLINLGAASWPAARTVERSLLSNVSSSHREAVFGLNGLAEEAEAVGETFALVFPPVRFYRGLTHGLFARPATRV